MTGLNLETFLHLLRTDPLVWTSLGVVVSLLGLMLWTSLRARRLLRRCLAMSVLLHVGLIATGGQTEWGQRFLRQLDMSGPAEARVESMSRIQVESDLGDGSAGREGLAERESASVSEDTGKSSRGLAVWDRPSLKATSRLVAEPLAMAGALRPALERPEAVRREEPSETEPIRPEVANPEPMAVPVSEPVESRAGEMELAAAAETESEIDPAELGGDLPEVTEPMARQEPAADVLAGARDLGGPLGRSGRVASTVIGPSMARAAVPLRPALPSLSGLPASGGGEVPALEGLAGSADLPLVPTEAELAAGDTGLAAPELSSTTPAPALAMPGRGMEPDRAGRPEVARPELLERPLRPDRAAVPLAIARSLRDESLPGTALLPRVPLSSRPLPDVPEVYRPRLDRNRSQLAQRAGASAGSEESVERALAWLARHQDQDGRWDAATGRDAEGRPVAGEDDFTVHCPPGEICFGTCHYWEADTAMTGLALLSYLGAGYTHLEGKHASTVERGLKFLMASQKPSGDLRGASLAVGMYCHAMASLALCEAYALTGDETLRGPAERAVRFLVRGRAADGMSWRYEPGAPTGDTSILGWVILVLKSAKEIGFEVPDSVPTGAERWLRLVSSGRDGGLAAYQPGQPVTATMTAEAWVCRQFLGVGGPGPSSAEAAVHLLEHPPSEEFNIYYWYYATLGMYQYGGSAWLKWNAELRDQLVSRQRVEGHQAGSWDPDESRWGRYGGRVYTTALATLTLEVYYRYLRLYDEPGLPPVIAPGQPRDGTGDATLKRASGR